LTSVAEITVVIEKFKVAFASFSSNEVWLIFIFLLAYHILILAITYLFIRGALSLRIRCLEAERDEFKRNWDNRDLSWKDREEELRRIICLEKDKEISQLKAEYDSYTELLEQKLMRSRTRET